MVMRNVALVSVTLVSATAALAFAPAPMPRARSGAATESDNRAHYTNIKKETEGKTCQW